MTFGDIYCGDGGASLGLVQAGLKPLWGIDSDKAACTTYRANIGKAICQDAASVDWAILERPDLLWASPPCQGFSVAGKRQKDDPRNFLVWGFVWAVAMLRPRAFLMENVPGVGQGAWAQFPSIVRMALETLGYNVSVFKIDAVDYGVPQHRRRVFWAGMLGGWVKVPPPTHAEGGMMGLKPWVTVREALGIPYDAPSLPVTATEGKGSIYPEKAARASDCLLLADGLNRGGTRTLDAPGFSVRGTGTQHGILEKPSRPVLAGNDKGTNPLRMRTQRTATGKAHTPVSEVEGRPSLTLSGEAPSINSPHHAIDHTGFSLKTHTKAEQSMGGDRLYRRLTVAECLILQGFSPSFRVLGNKTQQYKQVGNAVCPPVAEALARSVLEALAN